MIIISVYVFNKIRTKDIIMYMTLYKSELGSAIANDILNNNTWIRHLSVLMFMLFSLFSGDMVFRANNNTWNLYVYDCNSALYISIH